MDRRCCDVFVIDKDGNRELDYRYRPDAGFKRLNPIQSKQAADRILMHAAAQELVYVVVDDQKIEEGYRCTSCRETGKHTRQCAPPRGLSPA